MNLTLLVIIMDLDELEKTVRHVKNLVSKKWVGGSGLIYQPYLHVEVKNLLFQSSKLLQEYEYFFTESISSCYGFDKNETIMLLDRVRLIIQSERKIKVQIVEKRLFDSADDKVQQASNSYKNEEYSSAFHSLNTAIELALKDKLDIPVTITGINTSNVIEVLVSQKLGAYTYLDQAKKRVVVIDNKIKHTGYSPSKSECISAIKSIEDLLPRLRKSKITLSEDVKQKIYEGL